ncbi:4-oxalocrotonate decarboxylase [Geomicrobium sp. JCM 19037]|uniref:2-keto-4-pentenoate hydratase n=1 Tax=Geomicrobium sp. JCM 19037 TaxID=1460634 RepID=UPI00045F22C9|nr:fumarylacetoacetate hydrolase family protein [Geomicrobium sp. JCM 19037]GAK05709.1 4-oxalocrotonate decarboxylase [Geomicrobium sp. JCM 19037]
MNLTQLAQTVEYHQRHGKEMQKLTLTYPNLTVEDAYHIQKKTIQRYEDQGDKMVGWKMGLTSVAKQKSVNVEEPIYGRLTDGMTLSNASLVTKGLIHPKVEPEFAFHINKELKGSNITAADVWDATAEISLALEVIDSRYKNFSFTLTDVIADNASSTKYMLGSKRFKATDTDWSAVQVSVSLNGTEVQTGFGEAVLGNPVNAIIELTRMLNQVDLSIQPGMIVLSGAITEAVNVQAGDCLTASFSNLDTLSLHVHD